ncbi:MAG: hypothetical protein ACE5GM_00760 [bacterium]
MKIRSIGIFPYFTRYTEGGVSASDLWEPELKKVLNIKTTILTVPAGLTQKEFLKKLGTLSPKELTDYLGEDALPETVLCGEIIESHYRLAPRRGWYKTYKMKVVLYDLDKQKLWDGSVTIDGYLENEKTRAVHLLAKALAAALKE